MNEPNNPTPDPVSRHGSAALLALQFLTILPVKQVAHHDKATIGLSLLYYPLVGLLLGALLVTVSGFSAWLFPHLPQINLLLAALLLTLWVALTGALHLDGLADCADAWVGGFGSRQRTLELMKDPTSGPVAIAVVLLVLLIKFVTLSILLSAGAPWILLWTPFLARLSLLALLLTTPYVRPQGLGEILSRYFPRRAAMMTCIAGTLMLLLTGFSQALALLLCTGVILWLLRRMMMTQLGGCTGDTLGASVELVEAVCLVVLVAGLAGGQG